MSDAEITGIDVSGITQALQRSIRWLIDEGHLRGCTSRQEKVAFVRANIASKLVSERMIERALVALGE